MEEFLKTWIFKKGDKIRFSLKDSGEVYVGNYVDGNRYKIKVNNLVNQKDHSNLNGSFTYYIDEIKNMQGLVEDVVRDFKLKSEEAVANKPKKHMPENEIELLREAALNANIIDTLKEEYEHAVNVLKNSEVIGVTSLGNSEEVQSIQLLVMSVWGEVFIFDFQKLAKKNHVPEEIRNIFFNKQITKVVHSMRIIFPSLIEYYNVKIYNFYDTEYWEAQYAVKEGIENSLIYKSLPVALSNVLGISQSHFLRAMETDKYIEKWSERPLRDTRRFSAALLCAFLTPLKDALETALLIEVFDSTEAIYKHFSDLDDFNFVKRTNLNSSFLEDVEKFLQVPPPAPVRCIDNSDSFSTSDN